MLTIASTGQQLVHSRQFLETAGVLPLRDDNPTARTAWVTILLIVVNVGVYFLLQPAADDLPGSQEFAYEYAAIPCEVTTGEPLTLDEITGVEACDADSPEDGYFDDKYVWLAVVFSMFFHGGLLHLGGNMLFLWIFGNNIEDRMGPLRYLAFYLASGVVATFAHIALQPSDTVPLVGASGAVAGVMGAYLVWFPSAPIMTLFIFFFILFRRVQAKWLLGFWFVSQFFINPNEGIAWAAHVGGFVFGALAGLLLRSGHLLRRAPVRG